MIDFVLGLIASFVLSALMLPFIIKFNKKLSAGQTILHYVEEHKNKQGTATMGGVVFFISTLLVVFFANKIDVGWLMVFAVSACFALLGFMDDFIKIRYKQNLGLRPYQKIIGQFGISLILGCYVYFFSGNGGQLIVPFTFTIIDIGAFIIPLVVLVCIATTNSVNLTDGLDGLATSVSSIFFFALIVLFSIYSQKLFLSGSSQEILNRYSSLSMLCAVFTGSMLAFLLFNTYKASIFMGDVGSLGIGGLISAVCCVSGFTLFIPILGIMFVITALSDIIQVAYFKKTRKRVFKMAPIHHHFQQCGYSESKVVYSYSLITFLVGLLTVAISLAI